MKWIFKIILKLYLKYITKLVLFIHRPIVIAVAGSSNKTFIRHSICKCLTEHGFDIRTHDKNFNTEIGLPLAVLNLPSGYNSFQNWLPVMLQAFLLIFKKKFPAFIILELGVSSPKDMRFLLSIVNVKIGIVGNLSQRYLENFSDMDQMFKEYLFFIKKIQKDGLLVLNNDNLRINKLANLAQSDIKVKTFSIEGQADMRAHKISRTDQGMSFEIENRGNFNINSFGTHHVQAFLVSVIINEYVSKRYNEKRTQN